MSEARTPAEWEQRYREGDVPWDARRPEPRLLEAAAQLTCPAARVLDVGSGTGDNALYFAAAGWDVEGLDASETAVRTARERAAASGLAQARFAVADVREPLPVSAGWAGLALDRGCFHVLEAEERPAFVAHVAAALAPGGGWVLICGNIDEPRPEGVQGPPQLSARAVLDPLEPHFELHRLETTRFTGSDGRPTHRAWRAVVKKRSEGTEGRRIGGSALC